jgi:hypothetical protein
MKWTMLLGATALVACAGLSAHGQATEYTSQSAFDAVAPAAITNFFPGGDTLIVEPNDFTYKGVEYLSNVTPLDQATSGSPILFAIGPGLTPNYGQNFLSFQNTQTSISGNVTSVGAFYAVGFSFGSYVSTGGPATLTLQTTSDSGTYPIETFTVTPTSTAQFVGFTSPTPITSVAIDYPGYSFDLLSVTQGTAYKLDAVGGTPGDAVFLANGDKLYDEIDTSVGGANPSDTFEFAEGPTTLGSIDITDTDTVPGGGPFTVSVYDSVNNDVLGSATFSSLQAAAGYELSLDNSGDPSLASDPIELTVSDTGADPDLSLVFDNPVRGIGAVPEPSAWVLMLAGFGSLGVALRRRKRAHA